MMRIPIMRKAPRGQVKVNPQRKGQLSKKNCKPPPMHKAQEAPKPKAPTAAKTADSRPSSRASPEKMPSPARPSAGDEGGHEGVEAPSDMWESCIMPQIKDIVLWSLRTVMESVEHRKNSVELFGYDFMFSEEPGQDPKVWLIEVNKSPAMDYSTPITTPLVKKVMEDTAKVIVDLRENPNADTGEWEFMPHDADKQVVAWPIAAGKIELIGKQVEAPQETLPLASLANLLKRLVPSPCPRTTPEGPKRRS